MRRQAILIALTLALFGREAPVAAQSGDAPIAEQVAQVLFERGSTLFGQGDVASAKQLFIEAIEKSPAGAKAADARKMLRACNQRLGLTNLNDGLPGSRSGTSSGPPAPLDPYGGPEPGKPALQPGDPKGPPIVDPRLDGPHTGSSRLGLTIWSGGLGFVAGLALGGPMGDEVTDTEGNTEREVKGGAIVAALVGAGAGAAAVHFLSERYPLDRGQSAAVASGGTWGLVNLGFLGDVFTGDVSDTNHVFKIMTAGGVVGVVGGALYALKKKPTVGQVAVINSLSTYGIASGLLIGVAISPPRSEAYSLNSFFGSAVGITAGVLLADHLKLSRERTLWLDVGAAAGVASSWVVIYPLVADAGTNNDEQAIGAISVLTMAAGIGGAWFLTRHLDKASSSAEAATALLHHAPEHGWSLGTPTLTLLPSADPGRQPAFGVQLASGSF